MTLYFIVDILTTVSILQNQESDRENTAFIYSGLNAISDDGRKHLKHIAQSLIALQNRPGVPVPENVYRDIVRETAGEN